MVCCAVFYTVCILRCACSFVQRFTLCYITAFNCKVHKCLKPASHLQYVLQEHDKNTPCLNAQSVIHWATIQLNGAPINLSNTSQHIYVTGHHNAQMVMRYIVCCGRRSLSSFWCLVGPLVAHSKWMGHLVRIKGNSKAPLRLIQSRPPGVALRQSVQMNGLSMHQKFPTKLT